MATAHRWKSGPVVSDAVVSASAVSDGSVPDPVLRDGGPAVTDPGPDDAGFAEPASVVPQPPTNSPAASRISGAAGVLRRLVPVSPSSPSAETLISAASGSVNG